MPTTSPHTESTNAPGRRTSNRAAANLTCTSTKYEPTCLGTAARRGGDDRVQRDPIPDRHCRHRRPGANSRPARFRLPGDGRDLHRVRRDIPRFRFAHRRGAQARAVARTGEWAVLVQRICQRRRRAAGSRRGAGARVVLSRAKASRHYPGDGGGDFCLLAGDGACRRTSPPDEIHRRLHHGDLRDDCRRDRRHRQRPGGGRVLGAGVSTGLDLRDAIERCLASLPLATGAAA